MGVLRGHRNLGVGMSSFFRQDVISKLWYHNCIASIDSCILISTYKRALGAFIAKLQGVGKFFCVSAPGPTFFTPPMKNPGGVTVDMPFTY